MNDDRYGHWLHTGEFDAAVAPGQRGCALMPSQAHCWHEQLRLWDDLFPPAMVCCWCGGMTVEPEAVPHRHGPYATNLK